MIKGKSKELINRKEIICLGRALKNKIKKKENLHLLSELSMINPQDEMKLFYFLVDHLIAETKISKKNINNLFKLYEKGYTASDLAKGIIFECYMSA